MAKRYKVLTDRMVGVKKGDVIDGPVHPALIGTHLQDITEPAKLKCPACAIDDRVTAKARKATFSSLDELAAHYGAEHVGLAAPTEEEVETSG